MKAGKRLLQSPASLTVLFASFFSVAPNMSGAQDFEDFIMNWRDYKLLEVGGSSPSRVMDFRFNAEASYTEHPAMTICGVCLCSTGVFTGKYPELGLQLTWVTPTQVCGEGSEAYKAEAELAATFLDMTRIDVAGAALRFSSQTAQTMVFQLRNDMESCLNWFEHEGVLAAQNYCEDPVQVQVYAPRVDQTVDVEINANGAALADLSPGDAEGFLFSACPFGTQPTVPFNDQGFPEIRARNYECR